MTDDDNNLIPFPRGQFDRARNAVEATLDAEPVRTVRIYRACDHYRRGATVDAAARTVVCRGCGAPLDPIDLLDWIGSQRELIIRRGHALRHEVDHLAGRVERLKKDEANAKSRIRAARKRRGDRDALIAAASAVNEFGVGRSIGGYRPWETLSNAQREAVLDHVRAIVEAYAGALEHGGGGDAEVSVS